MNDLNIPEKSFLLAYMMKHVAAHYRANKRGDAMSQMFASFLEKEAKEIETETLNDILKYASSTPR